jgi:hypothetical protein
MLKYADFRYLNDKYGREYALLVERAENHEDEARRLDAEGKEERAEAFRAQARAYRNEAVRSIT